MGEFSDCVCAKNDLAWVKCEGEWGLKGVEAEELLLADEKRVDKICAEARDRDCWWRGKRFARSHNKVQVSKLRCLLILDIIPHDYDMCHTDMITQHQIILFDSNGDIRLISWYNGVGSESKCFCSAWKNSINFDSDWFDKDLVVTFGKVGWLYILKAWTAGYGYLK